MSNDPHDAENERQAILIADFLGGRFSRTPDSDQEHEARTLLAERLRYAPRLDKSVRWQLATLIDPAPPAGAVWKLVIKPRRKGRLPQRKRDQDIAWRIACFIWAGKQMKWAVDSVMRQYGVQRRTVYSAWHKHGDEAIAARGRMLTPEDCREAMLAWSLARRRRPCSSKREEQIAREAAERATRKAEEARGARNALSAISQA
jgi:hypothetical protein